MTLAQQFELKGERRGTQKGVHLGEAAVIIRHLNRRFNQVPDSYLTRIKQADAETLLLWSDKILDAKTLEEVEEVFA